MAVSGVGSQPAQLSGLVVLRLVPREWEEQKVVWEGFGREEIRMSHQIGSGLPGKELRWGLMERDSKGVVVSTYFYESSRGLLNRWVCWV